MKIEVDGEISKKEFHYWYIDWMFYHDRYSRICTKLEHIRQENPSDVTKKYTGAKKQKDGAISYLLRGEDGSVGFEWCLIRRVVPSAPSVIQNNRGMKENQMYLSVQI